MLNILIDFIGSTGFSVLTYKEIIVYLRILKKSTF